MTESKKKNFKNDCLNDEQHVEGFGYRQAATNVYMSLSQKKVHKPVPMSS